MSTHRTPKNFNPNEVSGPDRQEILQTWIKSGIEDFYLSFELENRWHRHSTFYCHQGLEKICKTYHIGKYLKHLENFKAESALIQGRTESPSL